MWLNTWNAERLERQTTRCLDRGFRILNFPLADITVGNEYLYNLTIYGRKHFVGTAVIIVHQNIATENLYTFILHGRLSCVNCKLLFRGMSDLKTHHTYQHLKSRLF